jgi:hypothetical protein
MLKILETKTERIELELRSDPSRSDREIGRICGVSHHTVGRRRAELGLLGNFGGENGKLGSLFAQEDCPPLQDCPPGPENCPENCPGVEIEAENPPPSDQEDSPAETVLLPAQGKITIGWNADGDMVLRQSDRPNEDAVIVIARDYLWTFIDRLTDQMGIPSTKGLTR